MQKRAIIMSIILCVLCAVLLVMCLVDGTEKHSMCTVIAAVSSAFNACMAARRRRDSE